MEPESSSERRALLDADGCSVVPSCDALRQYAYVSMEFAGDKALSYLGKELKKQKRPWKLRKYTLVILQSRGVMLEINEIHSCYRYGYIFIYAIAYGTVDTNSINDIHRSW